MKSDDTNTRVDYDSNGDPSVIFGDEEEGISTGNAVVEQMSTEKVEDLGLGLE